MRILTCLAAVSVFAAAFAAHAGIIVGPITNPANGHEYYLLTANTWSASEAEAEEMGGTLAVIRNSTEQKWVFSTFREYSGTERGLWIGLHRMTAGGEFVWADGTPLDYTDWSPGQPDNAGGNEMCVHLWGDPAVQGRWNDLPDASILNAVVEVCHKAAAALTKTQRALAGDWFENGKRDRACHIADTGNLLFAINESNNASGRILFHKNGYLFVASWQVHGEAFPDRILWSNGTWWSRKPVNYRPAETTSEQMSLSPLRDR